MSETKQQPVFDADGYDEISKALVDILNAYPELNDREKISFASLKKDSGIAFYPVSGAIVESVRAGTYETGDITGHVDATCQYPFFIIYRAAPRTGNQKINIKEWLDDLGRWAERLSEFPEITDGERTIKSITRQTPAYISSVSDDGVEDWQVSMVLRYSHVFDR